MHTRTLNFVSFCQYTNQTQISALKVPLMMYVLGGKLERRRKDNIY